MEMTPEEQEAIDKETTINLTYELKEIEDKKKEEEV